MLPRLPFHPRISSNLRISDIFGRYGGEEFLIICPKTDKESAYILAEKLRIGGVNVIEFMFHPDGSITGLKVIDSSGYAVLDDYSIELIEIAYKNYPKPQTSTKLRFNVQYRAY